jgi:phosphatidylglycerol lysyltransferase
LAHPDRHPDRHFHPHRHPHLHRPLDALKRHGADAVSFQAIKVDARWWTDAPPPEGTGAVVAYVTSGRSWIAIGSPLVDDALRATAARRFCAAARAEGRRAVFFGVEDVENVENVEGVEDVAGSLLPGGRRMILGLQSVLKPSEWESTLRQRPRLREQLRRARAKGVTVRAVEPGELADGMPLRAEVERLRSEWLASRAMEPLGFLVAVEPFHAADEHLYFVAERGGRAVQFLSAVPIYARHGWLMEDMLRGIGAPNGTTELLIAAIMRRLGGDPSWLTPGLTPLAGVIPPWLRVIKFATVALYDFSGLWRFRARLKPAAWTPIWLVWDRGPAPLVLVDVLRAFAGGRILPFAFRSLVWHPTGPPWAVAVPLAAWTVLLAGLVAAGETALLGYSRTSLGAWVAFDVVLAWLLFKAARKARPRRLIAVATIALFDAVVSVHHLGQIGFGPGPLAWLCRTIATAGPVIGTMALLWAAWRARRR